MSAIRGFSFAVLFFFQFFHSHLSAADISDIPAPDWGFGGQITSEDGYALLEWSIEDGIEPDVYLLIESGPSGSQSSFVDQSRLNIYRINPGRYVFRVQACQRDSAGYPVCGYRSGRQEVIVSEGVDDVYDVRQPVDWSVIKWDDELNVTARGPSQMRPGLWYSPERNGHGWSFYWANRLALPESHSSHGDEYDLMGIWYTYEAKSRFIDGPPPCGEGGFGLDCFWVYENYQPTALQLHLVRSGEQTYSGGIYMTRDGIASQVGSATVQMAADNDLATVEWSTSFRWQHLTGSDSLQLLAGNLAPSVANISHYSGFWGTPDHEDLMVVEDIGVYSEAVDIVFEDAQGDPGWIQASQSSTPSATATSLCFYYISSGYAPDSSGQIHFHNSGCNPSSSVDESNRNAWRSFTGFETGKLWINYELPAGSERGDVVIGTSTSPVDLGKVASFHRISLSGEEPVQCQLNQSMPVCNFSINWFSDGDYPGLSVFDHNTTTGVSRLITSDNRQTADGFTVSITDPGEHVFQLRMGESTNSTVIAQTGPVVVESSDIAAPVDFGFTWVNQAERKFELSWSHPRPGEVLHYEVEETYPPASDIQSLDVSPGSNTRLSLDKHAGPYGEYSYRVRACGANVCSSWSVSLPLMIDDPDASAGNVVHPWGESAPGTNSLNTDASFHYAMGYHFRAEMDGEITELGGFFNGNYMVRLYQRSGGQLLAEAWISSQNHWSYGSVEPVPVSEGEEYTVAVYLNGVGGSYYGSVDLPVTHGGITVLGSTYVSNTSSEPARPVNLLTSRMYGQADIGFRPQTTESNQPPIIETPLADQENQIGDVVSIQIPVTDPEGEAVSCFLSGLPEGVENDSGCVVSGTVAANPGRYEVSVIANDGETSSQPAMFEWTVTEMSAGANPEVPPQPAARPSFSIDAESTRVGATPGEASVDGSGAATYTVPLMTAAGSGGLSPALSLDYSSQMPNGVAGVGWTIGGLSAISRCAQTMEQDGTAHSRGISFSRDDRFCLDGQRLMLVSGQYGVSGSEYRTEIDSFVRVIAYGTAGTGPQYFKVWEQSGTVSEYGRTPDSRIEARAVNDPQTVATWARNRLTDSSGNYLLYDYDEPAGGVVDFSLQSIRYTGNQAAGVLPWAEIRMVYQQGRDDTAIAYTHSSAFQTTRLLTRIDSLASVGPGSTQLQPLRSYFLTYGEDGFGRKTLESLQECNDSKRSWCLPQTRFNWLKNEHGIDQRSVADSSIDQSSFKGLSVGDINGDGRPDLLIHDQNSKESMLKIAFATETAGFTPDSVNYSLPEYGADRKTAVVYAIDLNADGFQDTIYTRRNAKLISWYARLSNGAGLGQEFELINGCCGLEHPSIVRIMDFDGDGLPDLLTNRHSTGNEDNGDLVVFINAYRPGGQPGFETARVINVQLESNLFPEGPLAGGWVRDDQAPQFMNASPDSAVGTQPFDFNGDGRVDFIARIARRYIKCDFNCPLPVSGLSGSSATSHFNFAPSEEDGQTPGFGSRGIEYAWATLFVVFEAFGENEFREHSVLATGVGEDCKVVSICGFFSTLPGAQSLFPVDINADGLADIAFMDGSSEWFYQLNTGVQFLPPQPVASPANLDSSENGYFVDVNGDAYPDFVYPSAMKDAGAVWVVHTNVAGREFAAAVSSRMKHGDRSYGDASILLDFTGDGMLDNYFIRFSDDPNSSSRRSHSLTLQLGENLVTGIPGQAGNVITSIENGIGARSQFEYLPLTHRRVYTRLRNASALNWGNRSPVFDVVAPMYVVGTFAQSAPVYDDAAALHRNEYHYVGARIQAGGRGFLGFSEVIAYDPQTNIRTNTRFRQDFPFTGQVLDTAVVLASEAEKFATVSEVAMQGSSVWPTVTSTTTVPDSLVSSSVIQYVVNQWQEDVTSAGQKTWSRHLTATMDRKFTLSGQLQSRSLTTAEFGEFGILTRSVSRTWGADSGPADATITTKNTYSQPNLSKWNLGQLTATEVTHSRPGRVDIRRTSAFEYNPTTRMLTREAKQPGNPDLELVYVYQYDVFGNRISESLLAAGMKTRSQSNEFDSHGRFVEKQINAFGQVSGKVLQRDVYGNALKSENVDGVLMQSAADPLGRLFINYNETGGWDKTVFRNGSGIHCPASTAYHQLVVSAGGSTTISCHDVLQREIRSARPGFDGSFVYVDRYFDRSGRLQRESTPSFRGDRQYWTVHSYDASGRPIFIDAAGGDDMWFYWDEQASNHCASGSPGTSLIRNALGQEKLEVRNALGELDRVFDDRCGQVSYQQDAMGQVTEVIGFNNQTARMEYDAAGRKVLLDDPDKGVWRYRYNPMGELVRQLDAKRQAIDYEYDEMGRLIHRRELSDVASLSDTSGNVVHHEITQWQNSGSGTVKGKSQPLSVVYREGESGPVIHQQDLVYDDLGRVSETLSRVEDQSFSERLTYDQYGRIFQRFDVSGDFRGLRYVYRSGNYLEQIREAREGVDGVVYQQINGMDALGNVVWMKLGNGVEVFPQYAAGTGHLERLEAFDVNGLELQEIDYLFDVLGSLEERHDRTNGRNLIESFSYDELNRLTRVELTAPAAHVTSPMETLRLQYGDEGNITYKSDVGWYSYGQGNAGPHAVTSAGSDSYTYDMNGNQVSGAARTIRYGVIEKPLSVEKEGRSTAFVYGIGKKRIIRRDDNDIDGARTTYYLGSVKLIQDETGLKYRRALGGIATSDFYPTTGSSVTQYFVKDHLGSIHSITDESGTIQSASWMSFDAFGNRRAIDWQGSLTIAENQALAQLTSLGFTGHEQVDDLGIIHMNGRIYDPQLGRFLQADPFVQFPDNGQSLNRYSYVLNNPLSYTDPSGFFIKRFLKRWGPTIAAIALSVILPGPQGVLALHFGIGNTFAQAAITGFVAGAIGAGSLKGAVIGAITAVVVAGIVKAYSSPSGATKLAPADNMMPTEDNLLHQFGESGPPEGLYRITVRSDGAFDLVSGMTPDQIMPNDLIFTNGMKNDFRKAVLNGTTNISQAGLLKGSYVLNFNQTNGVVADLIEASTDILGAHTGLTHSVLAKNLANTVHTASQNGVTGLKLLGHSQGGAITASALRYAGKAGLNLSSLSSGSVVFHGAPVNAWLAKRQIGSLTTSTSVISRAQFGDAVHVLGGLNLSNPLEFPITLIRFPALFSSDVGLSPHSVPCLGGRGAICVK